MLNVQLKLIKLISLNLSFYVKNLSIASFLCTCTVRGQNELHAQEVNLSMAVSATLSNQQSATKKEREERKSLTRIKQRSEDGSSATSCHTDLSVQSWDSCVCVSVFDIIQRQRSDCLSRCHQTVFNLTALLFDRLSV